MLLELSPVDRLIAKVRMAHDPSGVLCFTDYAHPTTALVSVIFWAAQMSKLQQTVHISSDMLSSRIDAVEPAASHVPALKLTIAALDTRVTKLGTEQENLAEHCNLKLATTSEESQMHCLKLSERLAAVSAEVAESRNTVARLQTASTEQSRTLSTVQECLETAEQRSAQLVSRVQLIGSDLEVSLSQLTAETAKLKAEHEHMKNRLDTSDMLNQNQVTRQLTEWKLQCNFDIESVADELRSKLNDIDGKMKDGMGEFESFASRLQSMSGELKHVSETGTAIRHTLDHEIGRLETQWTIFTNDSQQALLELRAATDHDTKRLDQLFMKVRYLRNCAQPFPRSACCLLLGLVQKLSFAV